MNDNDFIDAIAHEWKRLGGDAEGVAWNWRRLKRRVEELGGNLTPIAGDGACSCTYDFATGERCSICSQHGNG